MQAGAVSTGTAIPLADGNADPHLSNSNIVKSVIQRLPEDSLQLNSSTEPALLGIHQMWTHKNYRRYLYRFGLHVLMDATTVRCYCAHAEILCVCPAGKAS